jgi:glycine/D-amino acid oxidase-like deaminating enzyme
LLDPESEVSVGRLAPFWHQVWETASVHWYMQGGQYTMTPDHRPLIGETEIEGLFVNGGYSGHGIMASAAGSRLLLDVMTGKVDARRNAFRLDREFLPREHDVI